MGLTVPQSYADVGIGSFPLALGFRGEPRRSHDFKWMLLLDLDRMKSDFTSIKSSSNTSGTIDYIEKGVSTLFGQFSKVGFEGDLNFFDYVGDLAETVVLPEDEYEVGEINMSGLHLPYLKGFRLPPITVTYLEDELSSAYYLHRVWQCLGSTWNPVENSTSGSTQREETLPDGKTKTKVTYNWNFTGAAHGNVDQGFGFAPLLTCSGIGVYLPTIRFVDGASASPKPPVTIPFLNSDKLGVMDAMGPGNLTKVGSGDDLSGQGWVTQFKGWAGIAALLAKAALNEVKNISDFTKAIESNLKSSARDLALGYGISYFENIFPTKIVRSPMSKSSSDFSKVTVTYTRVPNMTMIADRTDENKNTKPTQIRGFSGNSGGSSAAVSPSTKSYTDSR